MQISKSYRKNGDSINDFSIKINDKKNNLDSVIIKNIEEIIGVATQAYGSVEGKLEVVSKRHGLSFIVADIITDKAVKCIFKDEELLPKVFSSFDKRVSVYGLIRYNKHGDIVSILVDEFRVLMDKDKLPGFYDVLGIFNN